jgi:hypothetical protein
LGGEEECGEKGREGAVRKGGRYGRLEHRTRGSVRGQIKVSRNLSSAGYFIHIRIESRERLFSVVSCKYQCTKQTLVITRERRGKICGFVEPGRLPSLSLPASVYVTL